MIPIGILTKDRMDYLDVTLRSLSATDLPESTPVLLYDDGSTAASTQLYYTTSQPVSTTHAWPHDSKWRAAGLDVIQNNYYPPCGIAGKLPVVSLVYAGTGVVNASCAAIRDLFRRFPAARGVILLQDDILLKADWYARLRDTAGKVPKLGLLAGIKLNHKLHAHRAVNGFISSGVTAQCLYITAEAYRRCQDYLTREHVIQKRFDDTFRSTVVGTGLTAGCLFPFICQHIGVRSLVRPGYTWKSRNRGRIGYYVAPPYALAQSVRTFEGSAYATGDLHEVQPA